MSAFPADGPQTTRDRRRPESAEAKRPPKATSRPWPRPIGEAARRGLLGEWLAEVEPHTESDPALLLLTALVYIGNAVGRAPHFIADGSRHGANLFGVGVGDTSRARKGTSEQRGRALLRAADPAWTERIVGGLASGEGLVFHVRDPRETQGPKGKPIRDPGRSDHRLMTREGEFGRVLAAMGRQGNTLSAVMRSAWDGDDLRTLTRAEPLSATGAHVGLLGHITSRELSTLLADSDAWNGLANRILWFAGKRSKELPFGGRVDRDRTDELGQRLGAALERARRAARCYGFTDAAEREWPDMYHELTRALPGVLGAVTARSEAQVRRVALVYAIIDGADAVDLPHLLAAAEVNRYAIDSARWIFGDASGDRVQDRITVELRAAGDWVPRNEMRAWFGNHVDADRLTDALLALQLAGKAEVRYVETPGRPREELRWREGT